MKHSDITVIITFYNQPFEKLIFTLESTLRQRDARFDVVIADDCSKVDYSYELNEYFSSKNYSNYTIARTIQNSKTVLNILNALTFAKGEYVKVIGTGDAFADDTALSTILSFCRSGNVAVGFGRCAAFRSGVGEPQFKEFSAPSNRNKYSEFDNETILAHQLRNGDWVPGSLQFYNTKLLVSLLKELGRNAKVLYCEDFAQTLSLCTQEYQTQMLDRFILLYEFGDGISTKGNSDSVSKLYDDHLKFYKYISILKPYHNSYFFAYLLFLAKRFIALHFPLYSTLQNIVAKRYMDEPCFDLALESKTFFSICKHSANEYCNSIIN